MGGGGGWEEDKWEEEDWEEEEGGKGRSMCMCACVCEGVCVRYSLISFFLSSVLSRRLIPRKTRTPP